MDINQPISVLCDYGLNLRHLNQLEEQLGCVTVDDLRHITKTDILKCHQTSLGTVNDIRNALQRFVNGEITPGRDIDIFEIPEELKARVRAEQEKWSEREELEHRGGKGYTQEAYMPQTYKDEQMYKGKLLPRE